MSLQKLVTILKGGKGSGNFGHSGRPGKVGGSGGGGGKLPVGVKLLDKVPSGLHRYFITSANKVLDFSDVADGHAEFIMDNLDNVALRSTLGYSDEDVESIKSQNDPYYTIEIVLSNGAIRIAGDRNSLNIQTAEVDTRTFRRLQKLYDEGKLPALNPHKQHYWEDRQGYANAMFSTEEFLKSKYVVTENDYVFELKSKL